MKKFFFLFRAIIFLLFFVSCSTESTSVNESSSTSEPVKEWGSIEYGSLGEPKISAHLEGMGYVELNGKEYVIIPFADQFGTIYDYLRFFELDRQNMLLTDRTLELFDEPVKIGFPKQLFIEDFNNNGQKDFFLVDHGKEEVMIDGRFEGWYLQIYYASENGFNKQNFPGITDKRLFYHHADIADYNNNGYVDIISQRWASATEEVPGGSTISLLENNYGEFSLIDLENPPTGAGSVAFVDMGEGNKMNALAIDYLEEGGIVWYWDIENDRTEIINESDLEPTEIHDIVKIPNGRTERLIFLGEQYAHLDRSVSPIQYSDDYGSTIQPLDVNQLYQGRDVFKDDFNFNGLQDVYLYAIHDQYGSGAWADNFGNLIDAFWINSGDGSLRSPHSITDKFGNIYDNEKSVDFIPLKAGTEGYEFINIEDYFGVPHRFKLHELIIE